MKLNCDLGEKVNDNDALLMPYIDQANIACGFHASGPLTIQQTVKLAVEHNVTIGAHPSYPDKVNFGRYSMAFSAQELIAIIHYQLGALQAICQAEQSQVSYVKTHGALYNDMMADLDIFRHVCQALALFNPALPLMIQALPNNAEHQKIANQFQLTLWFEAFADRAYQENGLLVPRKEEGAVIHDKKQVLARLETLYQKGELATNTGKNISVQADTLCVHGDNPKAVLLVQNLHDRLNELKCS